jgi:hypothetical protein
MEPRQRALIILGMRRGATSAMAGIVNLLGAALGGRLVPASPDNERGYWEHIEVATLNELALGTMGLSWKDTRPLPTEWCMSDSIREIRRVLILILERDFAGSPLWALKDPRLCRLIPMWQGVFDALECEPMYIVMLRNPEEVWRSLVARDGSRRRMPTCSGCNICLKQKSGLEASGAYSSHMTSC